MIGAAIIMARNGTGGVEEKLLTRPWVTLQKSEIGRLCTFQDPVHEVGCAAEVLAQVDAIADQTAILDVLTRLLRSTA